MHTSSAPLRRFRRTASGRCAPFVLTCAAALAATITGPSSRTALAGDDEVLAAVFAQQAEADGDFEAWLPRLVDAVVADPNSPYVLAALRKIGAIHGSCAKPQVIEEKLAALATAGLADGESDEALRGILAARAAARGDDAAAEAFGSAAGYLSGFAAAGPFGWADAVLVREPYGPEDDVLDPKATWLGARAQVSWVVLPPAQNGTVDPSAHLKHHGNGVWYAVCRVKSPKTQSVSFKVGCADSFAVRVNGRAAVVADRETAHVPHRVWCDATLVEGWNRILVKVAGRSSFSLKVCDPATGKPLAGLEEGAPLEAGALPAPGPLPAARSYRTPSERAVLGRTAGGLRAAAAGFLAQSENRTWDAYGAWELAAGGSPSGVASANVSAGWGRFLSEFDPFPPVQRKLRAKKAFETALEASPGHASATVRLAEFENEDDRPDKAVKRLQALTAAKPSGFSWMALARIARGRGWSDEAIDAATAALAAQPASADAVEFLLDQERRLGNFAAVRARNERLLELNGSNRGAAQGIVFHLRAEGRHDEAIEALRKFAAKWPEEAGWRRQIADVQRLLGREKEAFAAYGELEKEFTLDESLPRIRGEILEVQGDTAAARAAYEKSLAIEPSQPQVRRALDRLLNRPEDFAAGWEPDAEDLIAKLPSTEELKAKHPKAVAVTVLDHTVTRFREDGTSSSYSHMIYKVLDEKGVDKYESLPNQGETLLVRAILPDGRIATPTGLAGRPYNVEGLVPGTVLEYRQLVHQPTTARGYDGDQFYFQDFEFDSNPNPVNLSRLVVIAPKGMKLEPVLRNYGGEPKVEERDGQVVTIYEKTDAPIIDPEANMPPRNEIVPHVDYSLPPELDRVARELYSTRTDTRATPFVHDALAQCLQGEGSQFVEHAQPFSLSGSGGGSGDRSKVRAIYDWVNREISGDGGSGSGPTAVLLEKAGDRSALIEAMIRAAGVNVRLGRAMTWQGIGSKLGEAGPSAFPGRFLWIEPRGEEPFPLFVMSHFAPFGMIPPAFRGSPAYLLDEHGGEITRLPQAMEDVDDRTEFRIRLGEKPEDVKLEGTVFMRGPNYYGWKRGLVDASQDDRRKFAERQLAQYFATPKLETFELPRLEERGVPMEVRLTAAMPTYLSAQGDRYTATLGIPKVNLTGQYVDRTDRTYDLVLQFRDDQSDRIVIDLGTAWEVAQLPSDHHAVHDVGTYSMSFREEGTTVVIRREYHFHPTRYRADEYKRFASWCKGVDDAEQSKIEFRRKR